MEFVDEMQLAALLAMAGSLQWLVKRAVGILRIATGDRIPAEYLPAVAFAVSLVLAVALKAIGWIPATATWPVSLAVGVVAGALAIEDYDTTRQLAKNAKAKAAARGRGVD